MNSYRWILTILFITFILLVIYATLIEPSNIVIEENKIYLKNLPKSFNGFRIVHISDLHLNSYGSREKEIINKIRKMRPDIIVVTGDLIDEKQYLNAGLEFMEKLASISPTYFVFGNWDHLSGVSIPLYEKYLAERKVIVLSNRHIMLSKNNEYIYLIGVDDPHTFHDDLNKAMENISENHVVKILLAHSPEIIDKAVEKNIDLVLVGHTHGGQIRLPIIGSLYVPLPPKYRKYDQGLFKVNNTLMFVNRGIGTSLIPVRFLCPPEIVIIELYREKVVEHV